MSKEVLVHGGAYSMQPATPSYTFEQLKQIAASFAKSGLFGVKDADSALSLLLVAQAEGRSPALVMRDYDIIQGRLAKKAEAMMRDFQASGGRIEWQELTDLRAAAIFSHPLAPKPLLIDWDIERAKKAGLATKEGGMYSKYTRAMLRSRCISEGVRSTAPGATGGSYTPEEVRAMEQDAPPAIGVDAAVAQAAEEVTKELPEDEMDSLIESLDVKTRVELITAYNTGLKILKERGNKAQFEKFKSWKEQMVSAIEGGAV